MPIFNTTMFVVKIKNNNTGIATRLKNVRIKKYLADTLRFYKILLKFLYLPKQPEILIVRYSPSSF